VVLRLSSSAPGLLARRGTAKAFDLALKEVASVRERSDDADQALHILVGRCNEELVRDLAKVGKVFLWGQRRHSRWWLVVFEQVIAWDSEIAGAQSGAIAIFFLKEFWCRRMLLWSFGMPELRQAFASSQLSRSLPAANPL